jgi:hypothetical protein
MRTSALRAGFIAVACFGASSSGLAEAPKSGFLGGAGAVLCEDWSRARKQNEEYRRDANAKPPILAFGLEAWVLGFVSGTAHGSGSAGPGVPNFLTDPSSDVTDDDVLIRTDVYCRAHKDAYLVQAALIVSADLIGAQADRMAERLRRYCLTAPNDARCAKP